MPAQLEQIAIKLFAALDAFDVDGVMRWVSDDVQEVHEISKRWLRGGDEGRGESPRHNGVNRRSGASSTTSTSESSAMWAC